MKSYSSFNAPAAKVVAKERPNLVVPNQALTVKDILNRFLKTGNLGTTIQNVPQYSPDQNAISHDSVDYHSLRKMDKLDSADFKKAVEDKVSEIKQKRDKWKRQTEFEANEASILKKATEIAAKQKEAAVPAS